VQSLLPALEGHFDGVFSSEVIEHLFDVGTYLESIHRLLRPGGTFILTTPYHGLVKNILLDVLNYCGHYDPLGQHIRFFDRKGLRMCLEKWGFTPRVWTGYGRVWPLWRSFFVVARSSD
jgi:SAM-dependent methyltransferase